MGKISLGPNNDYCPQTLFLYGTYDEQGRPVEYNIGYYRADSFTYCLEATR